MAAILALYGTGEGQTAGVADRVVDALRDRGHDAEARDVRSLPADVDLDRYDAALVGASIHAGTHQQAVRAFVEATGWHPDRAGVFGGALRYSECGFLERLLTKQIAKRTTGDTDTSRDSEYTDWEEVDAFAADFAAFVEGRLGTVPPATESGAEGGSE
jgi:menaquinone-dependent protoporphyrinogen oxidase